MSDLIWIQAVPHSDGVLEKKIKDLFLKKSADNRRGMENYPACNELMFILCHGECSGSVVERLT